MSKDSRGGDGGGDYGRPPAPGPAPFPLDPTYNDWVEKKRQYDNWTPPVSPITPVTPTPNVPDNNNNNNNNNNSNAGNGGKRVIKIATSNLFTDLLPTIAPELMTRRIFEEIGGMELLEISRTDSVDGFSQEYSPISNLSDLNMQYDPNAIISLQGVDKDYFQSLEISLDGHIPDYGTGPNGSIVYIDEDITSPTYNSLIINTVNVQDWERVEVDFLTFEVSLNDTIIET